MERYYLGVDLGSTNIKAALYDSAFRLVDRRSRAVAYLREGGCVEFDAVAYCEELLDLLAEVLGGRGAGELRQIALTGQAESLVVVGADGAPLMNAISWMDERSTEECRSLAGRFSPETCRRVTGQAAVLPTWPATKILWLRRNRPEIYGAARSYMLLKDYVVYYLTGRALADMSIATFSFYFDIYRKRYWRDMLDEIGISERQLPALCEPGEIAGPLLPTVAERLGVPGGTPVNIGTLDHFAGMVGTGNIAPGGVTLSTGTVMALSAMAPEGGAPSAGIAMHYGFLPDTYVMLPVAESGGASLEWFRRTCMPDMDLSRLDAVLSERTERQPLLFLPYLVGTNAPEFDARATGVFWGLRQEHDAYDMARAVMEGVSFVLRKNCEAIAAQGIALTSIFATGGGAKSSLWCQMHADATGLPVLVPAEREAACLGAAIIGAVRDGLFPDHAAAARACVSIGRSYTPHPSDFLERQYRRSCALYRAALEIADI